MDKKLSFYIDNNNFKEITKKKRGLNKVREKKEENNDVIKLVNGNIVLEDNSMYISKTKEEDMEIVEDEAIVTSSTFGKKRNNSRWKEKETIFFYEALGLCGLEFSMISTFFKNKDRRSCKLKYLLELKKNPKKINNVIRKVDKFDFEKIRKLKCKIENFEM